MRLMIDEPDEIFYQDTDYPSTVDLGQKGAAGRFPIGMVRRHTTSPLLLQLLPSSPPHPNQSTMRFPTSPLQSLLLSLLFTLSIASSLTITIPPSSLLPNANALPAGTHATLTSSSSGKHPLTAPLTRSSTFVFRSPAPAVTGNEESFLLDIHSSEFVFAPYRVDVSADGAVTGVWETFRGNPWENRGAEKYVRDAAKTAGDDVVVSAKVLGKREFYEERTKCIPFFPLESDLIGR